MTSCRIIWLIVCKDSWVTEVFSSGSNGEQRKNKVWVHCASQPLSTAPMVIVCSDTMDVFQETVENSRKYRISCRNSGDVQMGLLVRSGKNIPCYLDPRRDWSWAVELCFNWMYNGPNDYYKITARNWWIWGIGILRTSVTQWQMQGFMLNSSDLLPQSKLSNIIRHVHVFCLEGGGKKAYPAALKQQHECHEALLNPDAIH